MTLFNSNDIANLNSTIPLPSKPKKIVIIGAGGIVSDAHLPAYKKAGLEVLGIFDPQKDKATKCAEIFNIEKVYSSEDEAFLEKDVVFDIAVPPQVLAEVVKKIPQGSVCQLQKPMGNSMEDKTRRTLCVIELDGLAQRGHEEHRAAAEVCPVVEDSCK